MSEASSSGGRVAIVTGAARGIGAATALRLAQDGFAVGVLDLEEAAGKDTVQQIEAAGGRALAVGADVSDAEQVEAAGSARAFETAYALTAPGGTTVTVGLPHPDARASISPLSLTAEARTVVGSYLGSAVPSRDIPRYVELWRAGRLPLDRLVSDRITLDDLPAALDRLASGAALRQLVTF